MQVECRIVSLLNTHCTAARTSYQVIDYDVLDRNNSAVHVLITEKFRGIQGETTNIYGQ